MTTHSSGYVSFTMASFLIDSPSTISHPLFISLDGQSMSFHFYIEDNDVLKAKYEQLVKDYGGHVVENYKDCTEYTAFMVDKLYTTKYYYRPAFTVNYLLDCVMSKTLLNISDYIANNIFMRPDEFKRNDYMNVIYYKLYTFKDILNGTVSNQNSSNDVESQVDSNKNENEDQVSNRDCHQYRTTRSSPTVCLNPCDHCSITLQARVSADNNHKTDSRKRTNYRSPSESSLPESEHDESTPSVSHHSPVSSDDDDQIRPPTQSITSRNKDHKHTRKFYTKEEKQAILSYIVSENAYHMVGGTKLWKKMERKNICPRRTWMSLSNHFKRSLVKELKNYPFLSRRDIMLLGGR
ncbi:hypothetical protein O3M35_004432 [Rhynocoris fuscipes]|uniref:Telomeric repeat-binding factor 2-interacting protein 1 n=1 Tax=Rhynocoris fuscipes TaxID=488301 RepID=A0AAW1CHQ0_9HEMI